MSTPTDQHRDGRHDRLEQRLRDAAATVPQHPMPSDAWLEQQRRVARDGRRRSSRILAVAAAVVVVLGLAGAATLLGGHGPGAGPAQGGGDGAGDPWATENILGEPVVAETLALGGRETRHELVLTDTTGKGPSLCDRFVTVSDGSGAGGCTARQPDADDPGVAFDWLSGTTGGGDLHGVDVGVDARVMKVQIWMSNGDETLAVLHPTGWEDTKMFALTMQDGSGPIPQRLVAYSDATGTVLQSVDLGHAFGHGWLCSGGGCDAASGQWPFPGSGAPSDVKVNLGAATAAISVDVTADHTVHAQPRLRAGAIAAWQVTPTALVVVTGPEVVMVQVSDGDRLVGEVKAAPSRGSPWQVAVLRGLPPGIGDGTALVSGLDLVALDVTGHVVQRTRLTAGSG